MPVLDSDILYLYDAKLANPNGDPDEENRPRMDAAAGRDLASDVRLKRYLRDYWLSLGQDIWVRKREDGTTTDAKGRMKDLLDTYNKQTGNKVTQKDARNNRGFKEWLLDRLIDVRMFGATMPMENTSLTFTGPVQFGWGYSLHRVEINPSSTISSHFAGRESEYGTFGKDWRVYYSLLGFHGIVSRNRARHTRLTDEDISALDRALLEAIPLEATSRSKIGQVPRLYLRIEYLENPRNRLGDLREDIQLRPGEGKSLDTLRDIGDYSLSAERMISRIQDRQDQISQGYIYVHPDLTTTLLDDLRSILGDRLHRL